MTSPRLAAALARLDALVNWERRARTGMRPGIEPVVDLLARLGDPHLRFQAVHVTGTKGKGTTSSLVAHALTRAGISTGLYTSPHVEVVNERVAIDGAPAEDEVLAAALERALDARDAAVRARTAAEEATWFDVMTAAAFAVFAESSCEAAVVEVGIGGRLDSTNAIFGEVAIVTNVDLEHVEVLGRTRAAIAREKGGIVKRGAVLVTSLDASDEAGAVLAALARELDVPVKRPASLAPTVLRRNVDLARLALDALGERGWRGRDDRLVEAALLDEGLIESSRLPARLERFECEGTTVVVDGAHVASSVAQALEECSRDLALAGPPVVVLALGREKDATAILKALRARADTLVCTTVAHGPLRAPDPLVEEARALGFTAEKADDPVAALAKAIWLAGPRRWVLVIGSFYLAGAVRPKLRADTSRCSRSSPTCS